MFFLNLPQIFFDFIRLFIRKFPAVTQQTSCYFERKVVVIQTKHCDFCVQLSRLFLIIEINIRFNMKCFVPGCKHKLERNSTYNFVTVPYNKKRLDWFCAVGKDVGQANMKSTYYCCEICVIKIEVRHPTIVIKICKLKHL